VVSLLPTTTRTPVMQLCLSQSYPFNRTYNIRLGCFSAIDKEIKKSMYGTKHLYSVKLNKEIKNKIRLWQEQELWEQ
jgi:hypothetical protein